MSQYTPTTKKVRLGYAVSAIWPSATDPERAAEFDRWLAAHDAEVSAQGFREGVDFIDNDPSLSWGGSVVAGREEAARRVGELARQDGAS